MTLANDLPLVVSWFPTAKPDGPAIGDPEHTTWRALAGTERFRDQYAQGRARPRRWRGREFPDK
jgi:hypothetical protein